MPEIPRSLLETYSGGNLRYGIVIRSFGSARNEPSFDIVHRDGLFHIPANLLRFNKRWDSAYQRYFQQKRKVRHGSVVVFTALGSKQPFHDVSALEIVGNCSYSSSTKISSFIFNLLI